MASESCQTCLAACTGDSFYLPSSHTNWQAPVPWTPGAFGNNGKHTSGGHQWASKPRDGAECTHLKRATKRHTCRTVVFLILCNYYSLRRVSNLSSLSARLLVFSSVTLSFVWWFFFAEIVFTIICLWDVPLYYFIQIYLPVQLQMSRTWIPYCQHRMNSHWKHKIFFNPHVLKEF